MFPAEADVDATRCPWSGFGVGRTDDGVDGRSRASPAARSYCRSRAQPERRGLRGRAGDGCEYPGQHDGRRGPISTDGPNGPDANWLYANSLPILFGRRRFSAVPSHCSSTDPFCIMWVVAMMFDGAAGVPQFR